MRRISNLMMLFCLAVTFGSCDIIRNEDVIQDPQNCDVVVNHVGYNLDLNKMTAEVAAINSTGAIEIPASISASGKDFTVVSVGAYAAQNNQRLSSVKLPPSVTIIKKLAFNNCKVLKNIDFGDICQSVPVALMLIAMPVSGSIGHAIGIGLIAYTVIKLFTGRAKEVSVLTYVLSMIFLVKFFLVA